MFFPFFLPYSIDLNHVLSTKLEVWKWLKNYNCTCKFSGTNKIYLSHRSKIKMEQINNVCLLTAVLLESVIV